MIWILLPMITLVSGMVHTITGFGSGVVMMLVFPYILDMVAGPALVSAINFFLSLTLTFKFRKYLHPELIIFPVIPYLICSIGTIMALKHLDLRLLAIAFGFFLIALSLYFIFIAKHMSVRPNWRSAVVCGAFSGAGAGLFGIGGPLMVLYFMSMISSTHAYLGTIQLFFWTNSMYNTTLRFIKGILLPEHLVLMAFGVVGILIGGAVAGKIVDRLNVATMRKLIYVMIGIGGVINLLG